MTKKKTAAKGETKAKVTVSPTVKTADGITAVNDAELVNTAGINIEIVPENDQNDEADNVKAQPATKEQLEKLPSEMRGEAPEKVFPMPAQNIQTASSYTVVINTSQNPILLSGENKEESVFIAPKEIKSVNRELMKKLLQNKVVRHWFDKGILTANMDANETSANEAVAPQHLSQPVERHDGANVSASVTKFKKEGSVTINL